MPRHLTTVKLMTESKTILACDSLLCSGWRHQKWLTRVGKKCYHGDGITPQSTNKCSKLNNLTETAPALTWLPPPPTPPPPTPTPTLSSVLVSFQQFIRTLGPIQTSKAGTKHFRNYTCSNACARAHTRTHTHTHARTHTHTWMFPP